MTTADVLESLDRDKRELLSMCPADGFFVAADVAWSKPGPTGHALAGLVARRLLLRSDDAEKWGRSRYHITSLGREVQAEAAKRAREAMS